MRISQATKDLPAQYVIVFVTMDRLGLDSRSKPTGPEPARTTGVVSRPSGRDTTPCLR
jgi:hypothetical protein